MVILLKKEALVFLPTPVAPVCVDNENEYFIKRDDLTDFALGGNKSRKMEYFMADALEQNSDTLVTYGSANSNLCRVVSAAAVRYGMDCVLVKSVVHDSHEGANEKLIEMTGAKSILCQVSEVSETIEKTLAQLKKSGKRPYFIYGGGHGNIGTHAYTECYNEIKDLNFDYVFLASGTGTTQAGLVCGKLLSGGKETVVGISIARKNPYGGQVVSDSVMEYLKFSEKPERFDAKSIIFCDDYIQNGYASFDGDIHKSINQMYKDNSIILDPVYTGKAYSGMKKYIEQNNIKGKKVLFLHTGGLPVFFSDR